MKNIHEVLKGAVLTEKSNLMQELDNKVVLKVHPAANKIEIKEAVEEHFDVKVKKVSTARVKGKKRRHGVKSVGYANDWKKAIITLKEGKLDFTADL